MKIKIVTHRGPTLSQTRIKARIEVCRQVASWGGRLEDAAALMETITPNGLYYFLKKYDPETLRLVCREKKERGGNFTTPVKQAERRIKLINEFGYAEAARRLGMSRNSLWRWLKYRRSIGKADGFIRALPGEASDPGASAAHT